MALLEPFIDTVVICTMTALVIITTVYDPALAGTGVSGIELTTRAFASTLSWSPDATVHRRHPVRLLDHDHLVLLRPEGLYLSGRANRSADLGFKLFFLAFVVLGSSVNLAAVVDLSDALVFVVAIPNLLGLYLLAPVIKKELESYESNHR